LLGEHQGVSTRHFFPESYCVRGAAAHSIQEDQTTKATYKNRWRPRGFALALTIQSLSPSQDNFTEAQNDHTC